MTTTAIALDRDWHRSPVFCVTASPGGLKVLDDRISMYDCQLDPSHDGCEDADQPWQLLTRIWHV